MLKPQVHHHSHCAKTDLLLLNKSFIHGTGNLKSPLPVCLTSPPILAQSTKHKTLRVGFSRGNIKAAFLSKEKSTKVKALVTVQRSSPKIWKLNELGEKVQEIEDKFEDFLGLSSILLELASAEKDRSTGLEKNTIKGHAKKIETDEKEVKYEAKFEIPKDFGNVGAIIVENDYQREIFVKDIVLNGFSSGPITLNCNSWVQSKHDVPDEQERRIFFTNKSYLPSQTPSGLERLRKQALKNLRGNGEGERKEYERIYDYDVYNDLGDPDENETLKRPVLGGKDLPYPRRCRTGRPRSKKDPPSESRKGDFYVPRDESFAEVKENDFQLKTLYAALHSVVPILDEILIDENFPYFTAIDVLFDDGITIPPDNGDITKMVKNIIPRLYKAASDVDDAFQFELPPPMDKDKFFWYRDEEFARQTMAGLNPVCIQLVTKWPLMSTLDHKIYGSPESAITKELIEKEIRGYMTLDEAIKQKKIFILDYHDLLLPYVNKVRQLKGRTLYGSRTLFFLTPYGTLRPLAIELTRPPSPDGKPQWKKVFTPMTNWHSTDVWLWRFAKAHVLAHDSGVHQLVSHWLRTHCVVEPYIIAANRQLSVMHPIYKLLRPHFRYTMEINALARQKLISAAGVIESTFAPGKYAVELSSVAYDLQWRFDQQALPADLISRGLAVKDPKAEHGLRLTIEDYPYANDGLLIWDAIKTWVTDYVNHYYSNDNEVKSDEEIQAWWTEVRTKGHADKKDEPWWPALNTIQDLIDIVTNIAWVTSGHHAAVNFGQYTFAGYFPNRPTITRTSMPTEDPTPESWKSFLERPEDTLLQCFPSQQQAAKVMTVLDVLSTHSPDEEYLGDKVEPEWQEEPVIKAAFERFNGRLKEIEGIIDGRNASDKYKNRHGAGIVPYELLKPFSDPGVTSKGVPYSISI